MSLPRFGPTDRTAAPPGDRRTERPARAGHLRHRARARRAMLGGLAALLLSPAVAGAVVVTEITDPTPSATPSGLTADSGGVTWFTDPGAGRIGRVSPTNVIQGFNANLTASTYSPPPLTPSRIAVGPDGALWYTIEQGGIARITPTGAVTRYAVTPAGRTVGITAGADGAMWFTMPDQGSIGRITAPTDAEVGGGAVRGQVAVYSTDLSGSDPDDIALADDGSLWFTEPGSNTLGHAVPGSSSPAITHVPLPTAGGAPSRLTVGPDGRIWFSAPGSQRIGRLDASGQVVELPLPASLSQPGDVASGPDGALWFVSSGGGSDALGRITADGTTSRFPLPDPSGAPVELVRGSDGDLRYSRGGARIGRFDTTQPAAQQPPPSDVPPALVPVAGRSVILEAASGTVRVRRPGTATFVPLATGGTSLPDGTEVDARDGRVRLTAETAPRSGITRTAVFWDGRFVIHQARVAGAATEVRLTGKLECGANVARSRALPATKAKATKKATKKRKPKVGRRLWGDGKGDFRTRGARATASVRGTRWLVEDRCDQTTRVRVFTGVVQARDRIRNRRVTLTDGGEYVAPGPRRRKR